MAQSDGWRKIAITLKIPLCRSKRVIVMAWFRQPSRRYASGDLYSLGILHRESPNYERVRRSQCAETDSQGFVEIPADLQDASEQLAALRGGYPFGGLS